MEKIHGINLNCVQAFPNLKRLKISNFEITQEFIDTIANFKDLKFLEITRGSFSNVDFKSLESKLESIRFSNCPELPFEYPKVKDVMITKSAIDFSRIDFDVANKIFIQNSTIKNVRDLDQYDNIQKINLDGSELYDENEILIQDIKVSDKTIYTHEREVYYYDI
jgi:hypothetical protein